MNNKEQTTAASVLFSPSTTHKPKQPLSSSITIAATASNRPATNARSNNAVLPQHVRRVLQNYLLIWLDANFDESKDDFKKTLQFLRKIVVSITTFTNPQQCKDFLSTIKNEKVFMIVSGSLGHQLLPHIYTLPQLDSIYVFCGNPSVHKKWAKTISKVKGIYKQIEPIYTALQIDCERCDQAMISISFHRIDTFFIYTQLFKEVLLEIDDDNAKSIKDFVDYCRLQDDCPEDQIGMIEREYHQHKPIWWYTVSHFIRSMLNRGLRLLDVGIIFKMGFFIRQLHQCIEQLHREQQYTTTMASTPFQVFRGQVLSMYNLEKIKQTQGGLMSFNNFLSTSCDRHVSLNTFARSVANDSNLVDILFVITLDPRLYATSSTPFVNLKDLGSFEKKEEILFSTHTIFRIDQIKHIQDDHTDRLWQVNLTLASNDDNDLNTFTASMRGKLNGITGWSRLGEIFIKSGKSKKAKELYKILLQKESFSDKDRADYTFRLGKMYYDMGAYSKSLHFYKKSLNFKTKSVYPNNLGLIDSYSSIADVHAKMGEYSMALSLHEKVLDIRQKSLSPDHVDLSSSHRSIGKMYCNMGEYSKALSSHEKALNMRKKFLHPDNPDLADFYDSIGEVYFKSKEYSKALEFYERALDIRQKSLPPSDPGLASSYSNIANVYNEMGNYSKAFSSYMKALDIKKSSLPSDHPDLGSSYNDIGQIYNKMGQYSEALLSHEKALDIKKKSLHPKHPDFAISYHNIGDIYCSMGEYSKAILLYEKALKIRQKRLLPHHADLASSFKSIGLMYEKVGEQSKANSFYEKWQEVLKKSHPSTHPRVAQ